MDECDVTTVQKAMVDAIDGYMRYLIDRQKSQYPEHADEFDDERGWRRIELDESHLRTCHELANEYRCKPIVMIIGATKLVEKHNDNGYVNRMSEPELWLLLESAYQKATRYVEEQNNDLFPRLSRFLNSIK